MIEILKKSLLFRGFTNQNIEHLLKFIGTDLGEYSKNETVFLEDDKCNSIGIVISGSIELQTIFPSGKVITHLELVPADVFGEGLLFSSKNLYPINIQSKQASKILFIKKDNLMHGLLHHPILVQNFLMLLSDKLFYMNSKVKLLSLSTLRKKIALYLLTEYKETGMLTFKIRLNRKRLSEHLAVERPSLSRELIKMKEDGLIDFEQSAFKILNVDELENELFK